MKNETHVTRWMVILHAGDGPICAMFDNPQDAGLTYDGLVAEGEHKVELALCTSYETHTPVHLMPLGGVQPTLPEAEEMIQAFRRSHPELIGTWDKYAAEAHVLVPQADIEALRVALGNFKLLALALNIRFDMMESVAQPMRGIIKHIILGDDNADNDTDGNGA